MELERVTTGGEFPSPAQLAGLGELAFLFMRAPNYAVRAVEAMRHAIEPAIDTGHFAIMRHNGVPRAAVTWAFFDAATETRLLAGERLASADWMSGDRVWLMDLIAPYGQGSARAMVRHFEAALSADTTRYRFTRASRKPGMARLVTATRLPTGRFGSQVTHIPVPTTPTRRTRE